MTRVFIAGVGMTPFATPSKSETYDEIGVRSRPRAPADAGVDSTWWNRPTPAMSTATPPAGRRPVRPRATGIPVINVNNNCSTGSAALWLARQAVAGARLRARVRLRADAPGGAHQRLGRPARPVRPTSISVAADQRGASEAPMAARFFGGAGAPTRSATAPSPRRSPQFAVKSRSTRPQPVCGVPGPGDRRGGPGLAGDLRPPDPAAVLPADLRCGRRGRVSEEFARQHGLDRRCNRAPSR